MRCWLCLPWWGIVALAPAAGQESPARAIAPFIDDQTALVVRVDVSRLDITAALAQIKNWDVLPDEALEPVKEVLNKIRTAFLKAGGKDVYLVQPMDWRVKPCLLIPLQAGAEVANLKGLGMALTQKNRLTEDWHWLGHGQYLLAGDKGSIQRLQTLRAVEREEIGKAMAAVADAPVQAVFVPPAILRRSLRELLPPTLPAELGGGSSKVLSDGLSWLAIGVTATPHLSVKVVVQAKDADHAKGLKVLHEALLKAARQQKEVQEVLPQLEKLMVQLIPKVQGEQLTVQVDVKNLGLEIVGQKVKAQAARAQSSNNLKQMALAMYNYLDSHKAFPTYANHDKQGKPLLSWRVHMLPYLDQEPLYKQFRLDEPWDSEHNKKLIAKMPAVFRSPLQKAEVGKTCYVVPRGKYTVFPGPKGIKFPRDIPDGTTNTIMILEVNDANAVIWTKPDDFPADAKDALERLLRPKARFFLAAFADGSVRPIAQTVTPEMLRALFSRNGGDVVNLP